MNQKKRIVFLSQFSEQNVREKLNLKQFGFRRWLAKIRDKKMPIYQDYAIWVSEYLKEFEKYQEYEFHFVGPHKGMKNGVQTFEMNGVYYHFFKNDGCYLYDILNSRFRLEEKNNYYSNRKKIRTIIECIKPDLIILCGAENPNYALAVLDIRDIPVYVILQTLLNSAKCIEMGIGSPYRRETELQVFRRAEFFCDAEINAIDTIKRENANAIFLPAGFPTRNPRVSIPNKKDYDFVFYSRNVTSNKGIEDLLKALAVVKKSHSNVTLNIIGGIGEQYFIQLTSMIDDLDISNNVHFSGFYDLLEDTYNNVVKAKVVTVPGITASLNSTIREAMLMGMPVICYETFATKEINKGKKCLLTAKIEDYIDLANQMCWIIDNPTQSSTIATNGKEYADKVFSNEVIIKKTLDNCNKILEVYYKKDKL